MWVYCVAIWQAENLRTDTQKKKKKKKKKKTYPCVDLAVSLAGGKVYFTLARLVVHQVGVQEQAVATLSAAKVLRWLALRLPAFRCLAAVPKRGCLASRLTIVINNVCHVARIRHQGSKLD